MQSSSFTADRDAAEGHFRGNSCDVFQGTIQVGHDGDLLNLPAETTEVRRTNRLATFRRLETCKCLTLSRSPKPRARPTPASSLLCRAM